MVDNCKHVTKVNPARDHSILNPQKWICNDCGTTESVWACLNCAHVACGRYNEEHALNHYKDTKHPLALEVNDKYVFCYVCDEYVLNDNPAGDIRLLRGALSAIATQKFTDLESRGKRILRSRTFSGFYSRSANASHLLNEDKSYTALLHRRLRLLGKAFYTWRENVWKNRPPPPPKPPKPKPTRTPPVRKVPPPRKTTSSTTPPTVNKKKRTMIPGVVGLRNLGNTCYMNAILQVLSSMDEFRQHFLDSDPTASPGRKKSDASNTSPSSTVRQSPRLLQRQTTMECFQQVHSPLEGCSHKKGGLNGGGSGKSKAVQLANLQKSGVQSLSHELHALFRVMWSGKWGIVSPHSMLHAVWNIIPFFKGYTQQDAQEFLTELLDKVENEMQNAKSAQSRRLLKLANNLVTETFQGQLVSQVKCLACKNLSNTYEPFCDLSLEFPHRYQISGAYKIVSVESCNLTEMLAKFTDVEKLEGRIYACENCNSKRRRASLKPLVRTEAEKTFMINKLPKVIRLHLKRFRWSGRNHREKINTHVDFGEEIDMSPFCSDSEDGPFIYQLSAVVIHHGRGFSSGHYTAYCWNDEAETWVHCNDARVESCRVKEVTKSQAYILLYTRKNESVHFEELANALNAAPDEDSDDEVILNIKSEESKQTEVVQNVLSKLCSVSDGNDTGAGLQRCISMATDGMPPSDIIEKLIEKSEMTCSDENGNQEQVDLESNDVECDGISGGIGEDGLVLITNSGEGEVVTVISGSPPGTPGKSVGPETKSTPMNAPDVPNMIDRSPEKAMSPSKSEFHSGIVSSVNPVGNPGLSQTSIVFPSPKKSPRALDKVGNIFEVFINTPIIAQQNVELDHSQFSDTLMDRVEPSGSIGKCLKTPEKQASPEKSVFKPSVVNTPDKTLAKVIKSPEKLNQGSGHTQQLTENAANCQEKSVVSPEKHVVSFERGPCSPQGKSPEAGDNVSPEEQPLDKTISPVKAKREMTVIYPESPFRGRLRTDSQSDSEYERRTSQSPRLKLTSHSKSKKRPAEAEDLPRSLHKRQRTSTL